MLTKRIIPCLDVNAGRVVKGTRFLNLRDAGDPVEVAKKYDKESADELVFLDITASCEKRKILLNVVKKTAQSVFIPLTVGGGVRNLKDIQTLLANGADKVSINTSAVENPDFIKGAAKKFGSQCIVIAIDAKRQRAENRGQRTEDREQRTEDREQSGRAQVHKSTSAQEQQRTENRGQRTEDREQRTEDRGQKTENREQRTGDREKTHLSSLTSDLSPLTSRLRWEVYTYGGRKNTGLDVVRWARYVEKMGAGEILLTSMDKDGTKDGYDIELTKSVVEAVSIPVIASGGAGSKGDFYEGFAEAKASACLAASLFHFREIGIKELKLYLKKRGVPIRI